MKELLNLYNLRDKKNKFHIASLDHGQLILSDSVARLDQPIIEAIKNIVHERDKLILIPSSLINRDSTEITEYILVNTSRKSIEVSNSMICIVEGQLSTNDDCLDNSIIIGEAVLTISTNSVNLVSRSG